MSMSSKQRAIVNEAIEILSSLYKREDLSASSPKDVKTFCQLHLGNLEYEVFGVLFLDTGNRLIKFDHMFRGTLDQASVHPREVVKEALLCNAKSVLLSHNHPSGNSTASESDIRITSHLKDALYTFDIRVLDHIIVSPIETFSFCEKGIL